MHTNARISRWSWWCSQSFFSFCSIMFFFITRRHMDGGQESCKKRRTGCISYIKMEREGRWIPVKSFLLFWSWFSPSLFGFLKSYCVSRSSFSSTVTKCPPQGLSTSCGDDRHVYSYCHFPPSYVFLSMHLLNPDILFRRCDAIFVRLTFNFLNRKRWKFRLFSSPKVYLLREKYVWHEISSGREF